MSDRPEAGTKAPGFTAVAGGGECAAGHEGLLVEWAGRWVVPYFHAKARRADHVEKLLEELS